MPSAALPQMLTRAVLADLARLTEAAVLYDLPENVWEEATTGNQPSTPLTSREKAVFFAPPSVDGFKERAVKNDQKCEVRRRCFKCVKDLCTTYSAEFVAFIDTAKGTEKQALVLRMVLGGQPVLLIAFRGSKTRTDWFVTDPNVQFVPLQSVQRKASRSRGSSRWGRAASKSVDATHIAGEGEAGVSRWRHATSNRVDASHIAGEGAGVIRWRRAASKSMDATHLAGEWAARDQEEEEGEATEGSGDESESRMSDMSSSSTAEVATGGEAAQSRSVCPPSLATPPPGSPGAEESIALEPEEEVGSRRFMPILANSSAPCAARGMWRAYSGAPGRTKAGESPRARVLQVVEAELAARPKTTVLTTGHSLGGTLATLCAFELSSRGTIGPSSPCGCITFGSPRSFNWAFRRRMNELQASGRLFALRVVNVGDLVPRLPFDVPLGLVHAIPREYLLLSNPS